MGRSGRIVITYGKQQQQGRGQGKSQEQEQEQRQGTSDNSFQTASTNKSRDATKATDPKPTSLSATVAPATTVPKHSEQSQKTQQIVQTRTAITEESEADTVTAPAVATSAQSASPSLIPPHSTVNSRCLESPNIPQETFRQELSRVEWLRQGVLQEVEAVLKEDGSYNPNFSDGPGGTPECGWRINKDGDVEICSVTALTVPPEFTVNQLPHFLKLMDKNMVYDPELEIFDQNGPLTNHLGPLFSEHGFFVGYLPMELADSLEDSISQASKEDLKSVAEFCIGTLASHCGLEGLEESWDDCEIRRAGDSLISLSVRTTLELIIRARPLLVEEVLFALAQKNEMQIMFHAPGAIRLRALLEFTRIAVMCRSPHVSLYLINSCVKSPLCESGVEFILPLLHDLAQCAGRNLDRFVPVYLTLWKDLCKVLFELPELYETARDVLYEAMDAPWARRSCITGRVLDLPEGVGALQDVIVTRDDEVQIIISLLVYPEKAEAFIAEAAPRLNLSRQFFVWFAYYFPHLAKGAYKIMPRDGDSISLLERFLEFLTVLCVVLALVLGLCVLFQAGSDQEDSQKAMRPSYQPLPEGTFTHDHVHSHDYGHDHVHHHHHHHHGDEIL